MTVDTPITLTTNIGAIPGVGDRRAEAFRRLGVRSVADLIRHLPMRYEEELPEQDIATACETIGPLHGAEANITVRGEVLNTRLGHGRTPRFEATLHDETGTILLIWFHSNWLHNQIHPGAVLRVTGKAKRHGDQVQIINSRWEAIDPDHDVAPKEARLRPVYPATEDLSSRMIEIAMEAALDAGVAALEDHLHADFRRGHEMPELGEAYRLMHRPADENEVANGRRRLAYDELLLLQLGVMIKRHHRIKTLIAPALKHNDAIDRHITARFPFELTDSQRVVIDDIVGDITTATPMNRLLQGDVGAGKTVVALYAMLMAVAAEHQAALMAPTELLAEQHFASIGRMLGGSNVSIELLTGSLKQGERKALRERIESGEIDIVIGTHALLTEAVMFNSLAVTIIDEQHRFGVHQRAVLRTKASDEFLVPHTLVMTATPIPRTLSLTVFGDLDISTIRELPPGRQPIITRHVPQAGASPVYAYVNERLLAGDQAYIVVPVIDESDAGLTDLNSHLDYLRAGPLAGREVAAVHGRLDRTERDAIMDRFRNGTVQALVATTVIEVGVDVPNATIMVIEHADRFGLAQLHQLRGRVGRGDKTSLCTLIGDPATDDGRARLEAIVSSTDGFEIAEKDLEIRGPGELFGARQAGLAPFRVANLPADLELLAMARRDAQAWIEENPHLDGDRDALLKRRLLKAHGEALGLGDVA